MDDGHIDIFGLEWRLWWRHVFAIWIRASGDFSLLLIGSGLSRGPLALLTNSTFLEIGAIAGQGSRGGGSVV